MSTDLPDVQPGDVWKDRDKRGGPSVRVVELCNGNAGPCARVAPVVNPHAHVTSTDGKRPRTILLRRFRPIASGYDLVSQEGDEQ